MTSKEIKDAYSGPEANEWLREIAYQLAYLVELLTDEIKPKR